MTSLAAAQRLGIEPYSEAAVVELRPDASEADRATVIRAVYRQVLGNAYVMESERLTVPESQLKQGNISVREFVRQVAKSELYRSRFFDNCYRYRAIELNFKHLLGRAPESYEEMMAHSQLLDEGGYEAEIDSYLDSEEYQSNFGEWIVPYYRGFATQGLQKMVGFTRIFQLYRGYSSSDKAQIGGGKQPRLNREVIQNTSSPIYIGSTGTVLAGTSGGSRGRFYRVRVTQAPKIGRMARIRRSNMEYLIPYEQLSERLRQINRQGGQVTSITPA
ncbi:MAG: phycobilisome linker polypeptide [Hydrococcus sp. C42_A2020_068]|uniref:phycobilisome linker polypeptide n=1 Tax=Pleurocapsa sp. PCC 7327 TaxID=118163 RepID=UPI00029FB60B|nr:phycobilisome linker polypeptide [Pleurocapsa sp. PCC 7327]AFY77542.1 Phycobilisome Linker polypeptide/CpcD/allophycocyanin linker domain protein [Pleurocapsa sp. PCC 7327]MBF2019442.1 phycobilisome linker polypeptide [Hydrococcus sp. C42_A2020_068]